jgi:hypothetical protein
MSFKVKYPVEIGAFGRFEYGGKRLFDFWTTLEEAAHESWFVGMYSAEDVLRWGVNHGLATRDDAKMVLQALGYDESNAKILIDDFFLLQDRRAGKV